MNGSPPGISSTTNTTTEGNENTPLVSTPTVVAAASTASSTPAAMSHDSEGGGVGTTTTVVVEANTPLLEEGEGGDGLLSEGEERRSRAHSDEDTAGGQDAALDQADVAYSANSFMAVVKPVTLTMTLSAAITVALYSDAEGATNSALSIYEVYDESANTLDPSSVRLGKSLVNAFMIVLVLAAATMVIVWMYWMRCMRCLLGYMAMSSAVLLGLMGGAVWGSALDVFQLPCDAFTYYGALWNFAVVGVVAIFYQKGIPTVVTQGYLVATSIIMAWQLSRFEEWTGWCLLVVLALYDLCAVLTPCGPLKALVHLMQEYDEPMPGLLYEAELPAGPSRRPRRDHHSTSRRHRPPQQQPSEAVEQTRQCPEAEQRQHPEQGQHAAGVSGGRGPGASAAGLPKFPDQIFSGEGGEAERTEDGEREQEREAEMTKTTVEGTAATAEEETGASGATSTPSFSEPRPLETSASVAHPSPAVFELVHTSRGGERGRSPAYSPSSSVHVPDGTTRERSPASRGIVATTTGARRRRPVSLNDDGATVGDRDEEDVLLVRETVERERGSRVDFSTAQDDDHEGVSIKLGLGDFVFYSVLVSKAALYGFTAWAACVVVIVFGLGATLVLLAVYRMALPALPISIGLGTAFYLLTRFSMQPYVEALNDTSLYF